VASCKEKFIGELIAAHLHASDYSRQQSRKGTAPNSLSTTARHKNATTPLSVLPPRAGMRVARRVLLSHRWNPAAIFTTSNFDCHPFSCMASTLYAASKHRLSADACSLALSEAHASQLISGCQKHLAIVVNYPWLFRAHHLMQKGKEDLRSLENRRSSFLS
jgi:hypothetical protein